MKPSQWSVVLRFFFYLSNRFFLSLSLRLLHPLPGGHPAGRGDPVLPAEEGVPRGAPPPEEAQDGAHPLHDGVVHVRLLPDAALGLGAARLGHVPVWGWAPVPTSMLIYTALLHSILIHTAIQHSILLHSILIYTVVLHSILTDTGQFYSILLCSTLFYTTM